MALTGLRPIPVPPGLPTCVTGWAGGAVAGGERTNALRSPRGHRWIRRRLPKRRRSRHDPRVAMSTSPSTTRGWHLVDANGEGLILDEPAARGQRFGTRWIDDQRGCRFVLDGDNGDSNGNGPRMPLAQAELLMGMTFPPQRAAFFRELMKSLPSTPMQACYPNQASRDGELKYPIRPILRRQSP